MIRTSLLGLGCAPTERRPWSVASRVDGTPGPEFVSANWADLDTATDLARHAFPIFASLSFSQRADFLRAIADELEADREAILAAAHGETALPLARFEGELGRTTGQLRAIAGWLEDGAWADIRRDPALPDRKPAPRPDLRSMRRPLGPVAVFGASNFPLAFSVAGGDTASALAAGCPVIVKAHPAHPETSHRAALAIQRAAKRTSMPEGVFSLLFDDGHSIGMALVQHPEVRAVGFTGSRAGGQALMELARERATPIPIFAEMSSVNPLVVLPGVDSTAFAHAFVASLTLGVGQFCTNPGLVFAVDQDEAFLEEIARAIAATNPATMLTDGIQRAYERGLLEWTQTAMTLARVEAGAAVMVTDASTFCAQPHLQEEVFGPAALIVQCTGENEALMCLEELEGQLTASLHAGPGDDIRPFLGPLESIAGRLLYNQFPTGVEVAASMVHGGPYPSTSDGRSTSVGYRAIERWTRAICYQNFPDEYLPEALR